MKILPKSVNLQPDSPEKKRAQTYIIRNKKEYVTNNTAKIKSIIKITKKNYIAIKWTT